MPKIEVEVLSRNAPRPRKIKRETFDRVERANRKRGKFIAAAKAIWWLVKPRRASWTLVVAVAAVVTFGTPHILISHRCRWFRTEGEQCASCRYFGVQGMRTHGGRDSKCPAIVMIPVNWTALQAQVFR